MGMFDGIETAQISGGGAYFKPGAYKAKIISCKAIRDRKGVGTFVVESELLESSEPTLPVGSVCSWVVKLDKEPALGNIKAFVAAAMDADPKAVKAENVDQVCSEGNPLKDTILKVSATNITTKTGNPFTKVVWMSADGDTNEAA